MQLRHLSHFMILMMCFLGSTHLFGAQSRVDWDSHLKTARTLIKQDLKLSAALYLGADLINEGKQLKQIDLIEEIMKNLMKTDDAVDLGPSILYSIFVSAPQLLTIILPKDPTSSFLSYYQGLYLLREHKWQDAIVSLERVNRSSKYWPKSLFYLGVARIGLGQVDGALRDFESALAQADSTDEPQKVKNLSHLNIARIYYEKAKYSESIQHYAKISRSSPEWLDSLLESSWVFVLMEKPNNALGNIHTIHSPFFYEQFYPESFILSSYSFLRMCYFEYTKATLKIFHERYNNYPKNIKSWLDQTAQDYLVFFKSIKAYQKNKSSSNSDVAQVLHKLSKTGSYQRIQNMMDASDNNFKVLKAKNNPFKKSGLDQNLINLIEGAKQFVYRDANAEMKSSVLKSVSDVNLFMEQSKLIEAEVMLGNINNIRKNLGIVVKQNEINFIGGMQELKIDTDLEYWPFEGEYWEDELGGYVYNLNSQCSEGSAG